MKRNSISAVLVMAVAIAAASCQQAEEKLVPEIGINPEKVTFNSSASDKLVSLTCNTTWTASCSVPWVNVEPADGNGDTNVMISVKENVGPDGMCASERSATVTFIAFEDNNKDNMFNEGDVLTDTKVSTELNQFGEELVISLSSSIEECTFDYNGGTFDVTVDYNDEYTIEPSTDWITVVSTKGIATDSYTVTVAANKAHVDREGLITVTSGDQTAKIEITQTAKPDPKPLPGKSVALSGVFTVSSIGKTVQFAPGNLYWDGVEFAFEDSQMAGATTWDPKHVSHLYWTASADDSYALNYTDDGARTVFADTLSADWTLLSSNELQYLVDNHSWNRRVTIGDTMYGLVIAPDGVTADVPDAYTEEEWAAAEKAGYVLLPVMGERVADGVIKYSTFGWYWSHTYGSQEPGTLWYTDDYRGGVGIGTEKPSCGCMFRLVTVCSEGAVPDTNDGSFTVDKTGKRVTFLAGGNLVYNIKTGELSTEAKQSDYPTTYDSTHVGHFFFKDNVEAAAAAEYNAGSDDLASLKLFADGFYGSDFVILTSDEWKYIFDHSVCNRYVKVNGVRGAIIAPDGFSGNFDEMTGTEISEEDWEKYEQDGCIFLPASGYRSGDSIQGYESATSSSSNRRGYYWTSSYAGAITSGYGMYAAMFDSKSAYSGSFNAAFGISPQFGCAIRIARIVK